MDTQNFDKFEEINAEEEEEPQQDKEKGTSFIGYTFKRQEAAPTVDDDFFSKHMPIDSLPCVCTRFYMQKVHKNALSYSNIHP